MVFISRLFFFQMTQARFDQSLVRLNESIALLERQMEEGRKGIEQVLHAEITSRFVDELWRC